ncbi:hypothetical protein BAUCODRAFT_313167 [Baudoinia panamericana UAMH 10762]|uniref:Uncharacterized protein n=1 Tax=Baudoinia panamericana (strain UAMH 10762) TaxID=717646 RepID=M2LDH0_BAUPA|nr:uncharacterized protein BAUCODRAFT_313167 [Baudoinia panamericana UAMH 10762]EMC92007.1 hypothetical protein BAUCODRAFT_313167 [Baudoinia panamericana UAMH 10762]
MAAPTAIGMWHVLATYVALFDGLTFGIIPPPIPDSITELSQYLYIASFTSSKILYTSSSLTRSEWSFFADPVRTVAGLAAARSEPRRSNSSSDRFPVCRICLASRRSGLPVKRINPNGWKNCTPRAQ